MKVLAVVFAAILPMPSWADNYLLVGLFKPPVAGKSAWCLDYELEKITLDRRVDFEAKKREFFERKKGQAPATYLLAESAAGIYKSNTHSAAFNCTYQVLAVVTAPDLSAVHKKMEANLKSYTKSYASNPELVLPWPGTNNYQIKNRQYGELEVIFRGYRINDRLGMFTSGKNNSPDKAAVVVFQSKNWNAPKSIVVSPNHGFNFPLGQTDGVDISVEFIDYEGTSISLTDQLINFAKEKIREHVQLKEPETRPATPTGVRG